MVVYEKVQPEFSVQGMTKNKFLIDNQFGISQNGVLFTRHVICKLVDIPEKQIQNLVKYFYILK